MLALRLLAIPAIAAALVLGGCGDDDDDGFFTAPDGPAGGGGAFDADCEDDTFAPAVTSVRASPDMLWPPDHRMVPVTVHADAEDLCDPLGVTIESVSSDEPVDGLGDGDTAPDWEVTGPLAVRLRAERSGTSDGRVYRIRVRFSDGAGNDRIEYVEVVVPHDEG
jgi:hypothetical protein